MLLRVKICNKLFFTNPMHMLTKFHQNYLAAKTFVTIFRIYTTLI